MSPLSPPGFGRARNRLVIFGLALVILGWAILLADLFLSDAVLKAGSLVVVLALKGDIATLAQLTVLTGIGLALLGGLREGFGALNSFFDAVLHRSTPPRSTAMPDAAEEDEIVTVHQGPERMGQERMGQERMGPERPASAMPHRERNYVILPDGSVEVETLLGTRIFASMEEARDFIR